MVLMVFPARGTMTEIGGRNEVDSSPEHSRSVARQSLSDARCDRTGSLSPFGNLPCPAAIGHRLQLSSLPPQLVDFMNYMLMVTEYIFIHEPLESSSREFQFEFSEVAFLGLLTKEYGVIT
ncbi:hypothetical protein EVAR_38753_1 [Eumeta japonica]|uniref:Uncharacterized protein n=1 Tax=Eumeta variegata TaxID=151549 RepID=A0A4C1WM22_EUMVA|nr:hypothetical protein EVAR_38753_1 [Eumeta japonica]